MTTTETDVSTKPRWVECADKAADVLTIARDIPAGDRDVTLREADAWMRLSCIYRDGDRPSQP